MLAQQWPVFSRGAFDQDSAVRTGIVDFRCEIELGGVWIRPGDLVFGDMDGVVVVPRACEDEVLRRALDKVGSENLVRQAIEAGMSSTEALARFKVL